MRKRKFITVVITLVVVGAFLCGCSSSTSAIYNEVLSQTQQQISTLGNEAQSYSKMTFLEFWYFISMNAKKIAAPVMVVSFLFGFFIRRILKIKEPTIRRNTLIIFEIGVPMCMFLASYGLAILLTLFTT